MVRYGTVQYGTAQYTGQYGREELVVVVCGGKSGGRSGGASLATVRASIHPSLSKPAFAYCCTLTKYFCNTSTAQPQSAIKHTKQINFDSQISAKHRTLIILSESENAAVKMFLNLLTFGLWGKLGRLTHYAFDAVLISAFLAGMKRSTGLTPSFKRDSVSENKDVNYWIDRYLGVGETVLDYSVTLAGSSGFFERKR